MLALGHEGICLSTAKVLKMRYPQSLGQSNILEESGKED